MAVYGSANSTCLPLLVAAADQLYVRTSANTIFLETTTTITTVQLGHHLTAKDDYGRQTGNRFCGCIDENIYLSGCMYVCVSCEDKFNAQQANWHC